MGNLPEGSPESPSRALKIMCTQSGPQSLLLSKKGADLLKSKYGHIIKGPLNVLTRFDLTLNQRLSRGIAFECLGNLRKEHPSKNLVVRFRYSDSNPKIFRKTVVNERVSTTEFFDPFKPDWKMPEPEKSPDVPVSQA